MSLILFTAPNLSLFPREKDLVAVDAKSLTFCAPHDDGPFTWPAAPLRLSVGLVETTLISTKKLKSKDPTQ